MMKKTYIQPSAEMDILGTEEMVCGSVTSEQFGIGYGGRDEDGEKDPASRRQRDVWDDEW